MAACRGSQPVMLAQQLPCSAGDRLLDSTSMDFLHHADRWEYLRLGIGAAAQLSLLVGGQHRCKLCGGSVHELPHILCSCPSVDASRKVFLFKVGTFYASKLRGAPASDWPSMVLNPTCRNGGVAAGSGSRSHYSGSAKKHLGETRKTSNT